VSVAIYGKKRRERFSFPSYFLLLYKGSVVILNNPNFVYR
jgi:hypothetical protein